MTVGPALDPRHRRVYLKLGMRIPPEAVLISQGAEAVNTAPDSRHKPLILAPESLQAPTLRKWTIRCPQASIS